MSCIKHTFLTYLWASENIVLGMAHVKIELSALLIVEECLNFLVLWDVFSIFKLYFSLLFSVVLS